ncbi:MAG: protoporphyrin/coproporphyrin ferrochelatase, partial [Ilumatobacteraceae bacterium]
DRLADGKYHVTLGMKHAPPFIEESVAELAAQGFRRVVGMVLAPHYSAFSVGQYLDRLTIAATEHHMSVTGIESWATEPAFVEFVAAEIRSALASMPDQTRVMFTAHSLPERILETDDPYPSQLQATAQCVASSLDLDNWGVAWQSAGRTPEPWMRPDILTVIDELAADGYTQGVLVSAVGFVADHLEVLYDLDIEASSRATSQGLAFARTPSVNDDPAVMVALARRVIGAS